MSDNSPFTGFLAISSLYLKMTSPADRYVDEEEIELFIGSVDKSSLMSIIRKNETIDNFSEKAA
jgi:hypothetical protein